MNTMIMGLIYRSFKVVNLAYKNNIWMLDASQIRDDLIPISRQDGGIRIGNAGYWMIQICSPLKSGG
jgi:hypothetical protein